MNSTFPATLVFTFAELNNLYKIYLALVVVYHSIPNLFFFPDQVTYFLHFIIHHQQRVFCKAETGRNRSFHPNILRIEMPVSANNGGHVYLVGVFSNFFGSKIPLDLFGGLTKDGGCKQ